MQIQKLGVDKAISSGSKCWRDGQTGKWKFVEYADGRSPYFPKKYGVWPLKFRGGNGEKTHIFTGVYAILLLSPRFKKGGENGEHALLPLLFSPLNLRGQPPHFFRKNVGVGPSNLGG